MLLSVEFEARNSLLEREKAVEKCFKCATCALVCPVTLYVEGYSPKETFVYDVFSSSEPTANQNLWSCASCHKCYEVCPQDVNPPKVFENLKEVAFERGQAPLSVVALVKSVISTGVSFPLTETSKNRREQLGIPPFAPKGIDDLRKIAKNTGLEEKLKRLEAKKHDEHK